MRVLVARARPGPSEIAERLRACGVEVVEVPLVSVDELCDTARLDEALARLSEYRAVVFGCAAGVTALCLREPRLDCVIAVGEPARAALTEAGIVPSIVVAGACRDALSACAWHGARLLVVVGDEGRPSLVAELEALGATVETLIAYRMVRRMPDELPMVDVVALPSSSAARALLSSQHAEALRAVPMVAIGARTEDEARRWGAKVVVRAAEDTVPSLVKRVMGMQRRT